jgi:hypothetical protein
VYNAVANEIVGDACRGFDGTVLCYGQASAVTWNADDRHTASLAVHHLLRRRWYGMHYVSASFSNVFITAVLVVPALCNSTTQPISRVRALQCLRHWFGGMRLKEGN